jgi:hypothetical protein
MGLSWYVSGISTGERVEHEIRLPGLILRTGREVWFDGRVLTAAKPPAGFFELPNLEQLDAVVDVDWRCWHGQFLKFMRPDLPIQYIYRAESPFPDVRAAGDPQDVLIFSDLTTGVNHFNRRICLSHILYPQRQFELSTDIDAVTVKNELFWTVDVFAECGERVTAPFSHDKPGRFVGPPGAKWTECPWLLQAKAWQPVIDYQRRQTA